MRFSHKDFVYRLIIDAFENDQTINFIILFYELSTFLVATETMTVFLLKYFN